MTTRRAEMIRTGGFGGAPDCRTIGIPALGLGGDSVVEIPSGEVLSSEPGDPGSEPFGTGVCGNIRDGTTSHQCAGAGSSVPKGIKSSPASVCHSA